MTRVTTITTTWVRELQDALGPDSVLTDPDVTASYARDQAMFADAGQPAAVVLPRSTEEVSAVLRLASRHGVPVVPRGAGSGLVGAANAVDGCITLVLTRMDAVLEVAPADRLAVVQPGVVNKSLRDAVATERVLQLDRPRRRCRGHRHTVRRRPSPRDLHTRPVRRPDRGQCADLAASFRRDRGPRG